jgi:3-deoxy-7-phosphoheptulonate synthase
MIVVLAPTADAAAAREIGAVARQAGLRSVPDDATRPRRLALVGRAAGSNGPLVQELEQRADVSEVIVDAGPALLASRHFRPDPTPVVVGPLRIGGGGPPVLAAGPCAVESREQLLATAQAAVTAGASLLRGGAFKPRTSPYAFQGLGPEALRLLAEARRETGLPVVTEVLAPEQVELVAETADMLQIGARNMQNYALLAAAGAAARPVLIKRGPGATLEEWLLAAEYVLASGSPGVVLCERGLRHFDPRTRNILDLAGALAVRELTHLPVIIDPSHATGRRELVMPLALAGLAAGLDGVIVEVHPDPDSALSDGPQSLDLDGLSALAAGIRGIGVSLAKVSVPAASPSRTQGWTQTG